MDSSVETQRYWLARTGAVLAWVLTGASIGYLLAKLVRTSSPQAPQLGASSSH